MSWIRLDDGIFDNPKIAALSDAAKLAHIEAIVYCARGLTDGAIPMRKAKELASAKVIKELVPNLWEPTETGFRVHDYLEYNPSREQVLREREAAKQRMQGHRSPDVRANNGRTSGEVRKPRTPSRSPDPDPDPVPDPQNPPQAPPSPRRAVVVGFEDCFARLLSPTELELVKALEDEHPQSRIDFALREAAALNKRSVRYVQRTCERLANEESGDGGHGNREDRSKPAAGTHTNGVGSGASVMDRRLAFVASQRPIR